MLTGSQEGPFMQGVSESMAGRAAILQLLPLSVRESPRAGATKPAVAPGVRAQPWPEFLREG